MPELQWAYPQSRGEVDRTTIGELPILRHQFANEQSLTLENQVWIPRCSLDTRRYHCDAWRIEGEALVGCARHTSSRIHPSYWHCIGQLAPLLVHRSDDRPFMTNWYNHIELEDRNWTDNDVLSLNAHGAAHSIDLMWKAGTHKLRCWYVHLQEPLRRTRHWG